MTPDVTLNLYADRSVMVGDLCRYGEDPSHTWMRIGTIEEIGLRSTRIRGLDLERQEAAGKQVREWASAHELPFPEFPASYRKQIIDTLDYPPAGSPRADRG